MRRTLIIMWVFAIAAILGSAGTAIMELAMSLAGGPTALALVYAAMMVVGPPIVGAVFLDLQERRTSGKDGR